MTWLLAALLTLWTPETTAPELAQALQKKYDGAKDFSGRKGQPHARFRGLAGRTAGRNARRHSSPQAGPESQATGLRLAGARRGPRHSRHSGSGDGRRTRGEIELFVHKSEAKHRIG